MGPKLFNWLPAIAFGAAFALPVGAQEILPFPPKPSGSIAGRTMQESIYSPRPAVNHLPKDAPNILIVLIDDVGPGQTDTYGGEIHTPTLDKHRERRHFIQSLSHDRDVLAHPRGVADRAKPSPRRERPDRRVGQ